MAFTVNRPSATVGSTYSSVIEPPSGYKEYSGPSVNTAAMTMKFKYLSTGGSGSYKWNLGVVKIDNNENDVWEFIFEVSTDGGRSFSEVERKKPVMMATSGGGGTVTIPGLKKKDPFWKRLFGWS